MMEVEDRYEYKRLKTLEQIKSESSGYKEYDGEVVLYDEGEIVIEMFPYFGGYIYVRKGYRDRRYYDQKDYYYLPDWFLPDVDPTIDNLFEDLLEGI